eukprot:1486972-Amphidinium_carterae.1
MAWPRIATATATLSAISKEIAPGARQAMTSKPIMHKAQHEFPIPKQMLPKDFKACERLQDHSCDGK